jgi:hypothetical protein
VIRSVPNFHYGCYCCSRGIFPGHRHIPRPEDEPRSFTLPTLNGRPQVYVGSWER